MLNDPRRIGNRRVDDFLTQTDGQETSIADGNQIPRIALGWLKELVHREFASAPVFSVEQLEPGPSPTLGEADEVDISV